LAAFLSRLFPGAPRRFSLARWRDEDPGFASAFLWKANRLPASLPDPLWLHLGCGENVLEGFLNLDFLPHDARVAEWDLLDPWPEAWPLPVRGAFSEDTLEHFFLAEQLHILCEVNRALGAGDVFRVLMPSYERLLAYCRDFRPRRDEFLQATFAVETECDAVNAGLRFSGHRWLHDDTSLAHLARLAGFEAVKTTCAQSTVPHLAGRNLRDEAGSAAFAHDLVKRRGVTRLVVPPTATTGLETLETLEGGIVVGEIREPGARVAYRLPSPVAVGDIASVNARGANLSSWREHSLKRLLFRGDGREGAWSLDETLKSRPCMNLAMPAAVALACGEAVRAVEEVCLEPGRPGDRVTVGPLELFAYAPA